MQLDWLKARQTKYTAYAAVYILVIIGVLGAINWLANRYNKSFDSTANKRYSLSDQTEKVVKNLSQDVTISYFDRSTDFQRAKDLLDRYANLSPRLRVEYVDPEKKPQLARSLDVRSYGTIYVQTGDRREEAKSLSEEELTSALVRSLKTEVRTVCAVTGSGERSLEDAERAGYSNLKEALERDNFQTRTISLLEKPEVPQECTVLLIGGPRFNYTEAAVNAIRTFAENGGSVLLMLDPPLQLGKEPIAENPLLVQLAQNWGVQYQKNLVIDSSGIGQLFGLSEIVPLVTEYTGHAIVREMKGVATAFPLARVVEAGGGAEGLVSTTGSSYATTNLSSPQVSVDSSKAQAGPFNLAAAGTLSGGNGKGRFVAVGSSGWVANNILRFNGNRDLALNMVNWLTADEDLISIRPKEPENRPLALSVAQMRLILWTSLIALPLIVVVAGVSVWWKRR
jgi:ABC-type uncharacterized transport system involved in gliding motility auxiliary subunit